MRCESLANFLSEPPCEAQPRHARMKRRLLLRNSYCLHALIRGSADNRAQAAVANAATARDPDGRVTAAGEVRQPPKPAEYDVGHVEADQEDNESLLHSDSLSASGASSEAGGDDEPAAAQ